MTKIADRADDAFLESLTVAMAIAPGVYSRNRMFALFAKPGVSKAKFRAAALRGMVKQLARAVGISLSRERAVHVLRYQIPALRLTRVAELSDVELATIRILLEQAKVPCFPPDPEDRKLVDRVLARLLESSTPRPELGGVRF